MTKNTEDISQPSNVVSLPDDIKPEDFPELLEQTLVSFNDGDVGLIDASSFVVNIMHN